MTKVIFEIGILAFCVAVVCFGLQENDMLEVTAHAFMVFIVVMCAMMLILLLAGSFSRHNVEQVKQDEAQAAEPKTAPGSVK